MSSNETITEVREYHGKDSQYGWSEAGFQVVTTEQTITLAIDDEPACCETWGYFLTEDDMTKFIGAELRGVRLTDTNRSGRQFISGYGTEGAKGDPRPVEDLDEGDVMFVDIETDRGVLQFVAYNAHNGYYGHEARVSSKQLTHAEPL